MACSKASSSDILVRSIEILRNSKPVFSLLSPPVNFKLEKKLKKREANLKEQAKKDSEQKQKPKNQKKKKIFQFLVFNFFFIFHKKSLVSIKIEQEKVEF